ASVYFRRSSLAAKRAEEKQRQATISLSLKSLESLPSKKVVFHSDSEDEPVVSEMFVNRHFGKRGAKLAKLEAKFGHDARFRMDEKFMDSDDEKLKYKIFYQILKAPGFRRFDPENELHLQWVESTKKKKKKENENPDDVLCEGKDDSFSFLKSIGRKPDINLESNASDDIKENKVEVRGYFQLKDDSVYRSSDINLISSTVPVSSAFFLSDNDNEVIQGLKYFRRKRSIEDIRNKWCNVRHGIIKVSFILLDSTDSWFDSCNFVFLFIYIEKEYFCHIRNGFKILII
uniref:NUC153 domain-containing protein n=1 Tax=Syphacia muris TaxID=451379 RepID=A0A0N5AS44_9BILA